MRGWEGFDGGSVWHEPTLALHMLHHYLLLDLGLLDLGTCCGHVQCSAASRGTGTEGCLAVLMQVCLLVNESSLSCLPADAAAAVFLQCLVAAANADQARKEQLVLINTRLLALVTAFDSVAADTAKLEAAAEVYRDLLSSVSVWWLSCHHQKHSQQQQQPCRRPTCFQTLLLSL